MQSKSADSGSAVKWVKASGGHIPENSFIGGHQKTGEKLYVSRASYGGGIHIGKIRPEFKACLLPWGGVQRHCQDYEVLQVMKGEWVKDFAGNVPPNAIKAGHEGDGKPLYIGRVNFQGGIHVGKVGPHFTGCHFSWGGKELSMAEYEVLAPGNFWIDADSGNVPPGSMQGGTCEGKPLYVVRTKFKGEVIPGKLWGYACHFPHGGKELMNAEYQVLKNVPGKWVKASKGEIPTAALYCGKESDGQSLFLARAEYVNGVHPGKIRHGYAGARISWGGLEHECQNYEVYCPDNKMDPQF